MQFGKHYDRDGAVNVLQGLISCRIEEQKHAPGQDVQYFGNINLDNTVIHEGARQNGGRRIWKLAAIPANGVIEHEMTFRVHGVLSKINLVPGEISQASALTQRVEIVGIGAAAFDDMILNTKLVTDSFRRFLGPQHSPEWNIGEGYGDIRLNCSNLYLTRAHGRDYEEIPFGPGVDPFGKFAKYKAQGYVHTAANVVRYFRRGVGQDKDVLYDCFPANFRAGDIVEVQGNIIAFTTKDNAIKIVFQMNALTLEDGTFSRAAEQARAREHVAPPAHIELKRKNWYEEEDEDMDVGRTRRKFKDLRLVDGPSRGVDKQ
ncbi:hypothetical protein R3P38DRAFT_3196898 [Favolaschia claudopus]|uniref:Uncharacterized protein n=1 Tax=Favolaschia claudopus TaxID=2862362 RepID=A0AAW0B509_9AGAR